MSYFILICAATMFTNGVRSFRRWRAFYWKAVYVCSQPDWGTPMDVAIANALHRHVVFYRTMTFVFIGMGALYVWAAFQQGLSP